VGIYWVAPVALSFYAARKAPAVVKITPTDLKDRTVSRASGMRLSYVGYDFEVPWSDLDDSKTELYPKDKPQKNKALLTFRSGLRLVVIAVPPQEFAHQFATEFKMSPQKVEAVFGHGSASSDYSFVRNTYEFSPVTMHYWSLSDSVHTREQMVLMVKSIIPSKSAETGIFNVENPNYKGFQQGDPLIRQDSLLVDLYSNDGSFEIMFLQRNYGRTEGITQPEINRIIQTLHRSTPTEVVASTN
jgi:hypothetical protein